MLGRLSLVAVVLVTAACSSASEDAPTTPEPVATTMKTPLPPPPVLSASFEPASADCNGWLAPGARSIRSVPARSGTYACKICSEGTTPGIGIEREVRAIEAGSYAFSAWIRKRPQNAAPPLAVASLEAATVRGVISVATPSVSVHDEWERVETKIDVPEGATSLTVHIGAPSAAVDECVLIDDVSLARIEP